MAQSGMESLLDNHYLPYLVGMYAINIIHFILGIDMKVHTV